MSELGRFILGALKHPDKWTFDCYRATYKSTMTLWIANGPCFLNVENGPGRFGIIERYRIWRAVVRCYTAKLEDLP